ncbi:phage portal protein [Salibacterium salarium]|uniref:Phage portal protein n=1 Tax=Salibacterium salarium TaxID=284579 RepID=A0A428MSR5_9BACI|nr:phage tail tube protein [Salibacterium salarium]RSL29098.1 phage portal protein [Salibacterium salarium]
MAQPLDSSRVIDGTFGEVRQDGRWLTNVYSVEANVSISYNDVSRSGTRWTGKKPGALEGTGTMTGYKVTSDLAKSIGSITEDRGTPYVTELIFKLDDPQSFGAERVRLKNVQFEQITLGNFEVGSIVEEETPFNFDGYEFLDEITAG